MRPWRGIDPGTTSDPRLREAFLSINEFLHDLSASIRSIGTGQEPVASGGTTIGVSDGDKGDILVSGSGATWTIDATGVASATTFLDGTRAWSTPDHGSIGGLTDDDHTQYLRLAGRSGGQTATSGDNAAINLTVKGGTNSAIAVQRWTNDAADTTLDVKVVGGGTPAVSLFTDAGTGLNLTAGGSTVGLQISSSLIQMIGAKGGYGSGTSALFNVDAAAMSSTVADGDDNLRIIRRASTQTGKAINFMEQTRTTTLFSVTKDGYVSTPQLLLNGATSGTLTVVPAAVTTNHTETWPAANASGVLTNNGSGTLSWTPASVTNALLDGANHTDTTNSACTRGDLVYGNSSAQWDDLAIGGANTVLKSNGTDPSWGTIGAAHIDNRTRSVFLDPNFFSTVATTLSGSNPDSITRKSCAGASDTTFYATFGIPDDYASNGTFSIYYSSQGTSTDTSTWEVFYKDITNASVDVTAAYDNTDTVSSNPPGTAGLLVIESGLLAAATYTSGGTARMAVRRTGSTDTNNDALSFHGLRFTYTADM